MCKSCSIHVRDDEKSQQILSALKILWSQSIWSQNVHVVPECVKCYTSSLSVMHHNGKRDFSQINRFVKSFIQQLKFLILTYSKSLINFLACWNSNTKFNSFEFEAYQRLHLIFWSRHFFEHQIWSNWKNIQTSNVCSDKGYSLHFFPCVSLCRVNYSQSIST